METTTKNQISLNKVYEVYPKHEILSLDSFFVDNGGGWLETSIVRTTPFISVIDDCNFAVERGARTFCFLLKNEHGQTFNSDFTVNELRINEERI